jgi:predicted DsbA family dithiol-disulfide isomerase
MTRRKETSRAFRRLAGRTGSGICLLLLIGCRGDGAAPAAITVASAAPAEVRSVADLPDVLAMVAGEEITMEDVRQRIGDDLEQLDMLYRQRRHQAVQSTLDAILRERVVQAAAKEHDTTLEGLALEEAGGSFNPTDIEVQAWYDTNRERTGGRSLESIRGQVEEMLRKERREAALSAVEQRLYREQGVSVLLEPFRVDLDNSRAPAVGPEDAPITLVEFADFQCPYCGRLFPTLKRVEEEFGDRIRIVYRQYPIASLHPNAFKAAEASLCAGEQDRFWEFHDLLFADQSRLAVSDLKEKAGRLGLDRQDFDTCLDTGRHVEQVQTDMKEGRRAGVTGTPALFVNGVRVPGGAVGFDAIAKAIATEEARLNQ